MHLKYPGTKKEPDLFGYDCLISDGGRDEKEAHKNLMAWQRALYEWILGHVTYGSDNDR